MTLLKQLVCFIASMSIGVSACTTGDVQRPDRPVVSTSLGKVVGIADAASRRFVVRYGAQTRFQDSVIPEKVASYDASGLPPACPQPGLDGTSEDCLFLSIYTPLNPLAKRLPVLFWVHGGSFYTGSSSSFGLDGADLATKEQMIVVVVQYRLGLLGFMKNDALGLTGNYGLKDLVLALQYVQREIGSFGGDPRRVTLAGQSSGAELVKTLLVTPSATPYFARAILQSAPLGLKDQSPETGEVISDMALSQLKCSTASDLAQVSVEEILAAQDSVINVGRAGGIPGLGPTESFIRPVVDGVLVNGEFQDVLATGGSLEGPRKHLLLTVMKEEGALAISGLIPSPIDPAFFPGVVQQFYPEQASAILQSGLYDPTKLSSPDATRDSLVALGTDFNWICANQQAAVDLAERGSTVFFGQYNLGVSYTNDTIPFLVHRPTHQDDIYALFNPSGIRLNRPQRVLVPEVQARWGAFVRDGSPNAAGYAVWPPVQNSKQLNLLLLGDGVRGTSRLNTGDRTAQKAIDLGVWKRS